MRALAGAIDSIERGRFGEPPLPHNGRRLTQTPLQRSVLAMSGEIKLTNRNALRVLRPGPFRRYIIGSAISDTGTWMQVMAQGYVMATLTNKALLLGMA